MQTIPFEQMRKRNERVRTNIVAVMKCLEIEPVDKVKINKLLDEAFAMVAFQKIQIEQLQATPITVDETEMEELKMIATMNISNQFHLERVISKLK